MPALDRPAAHAHHHGMRVKDRLEQWLLGRADQWVARRRRRPPPGEQLAAARVVAHRGVYDNVDVFENSLAAFEAFHRAGGWGIELDVQWTRDHVPVVTHDPDGRRLFGVPQAVAAMDLESLRRRLPLVPSLADVVDRYGGRMHLMVEIKSLPEGSGRPREILARHFEHLVPGRDYHLLSLDPEILARLAFTPGLACVPIARTRLRNLSRAVQTHDWGGLAGHYALIGRRHIAALHGRGLRVGTGFVNSPYCLYREVVRGVDWLFSDRPLVLQNTLSRLSGGIFHP